MKQPHALLGFLFFVSGISGLIYEVAWSRYLSLILGNTTQAHALLLAVFLSGLALGNWFFGASCETLRRPVRVYAFLELGIAAWCALYPFLHRGAAALNLSRFAFESVPATGFVIQLLLCAVLLWVPSFLMGGTLPVILRAFGRKTEEVRQHVSLLYALNSLGAVLGSLSASLLFIPRMGLDGTIFAGAALSALAGILALFLSFGSNDSGANAPKSGNGSAGEKPKSLSDPQRRVLLAAVFLSGFIGLTLELGWFRFFTLVLGSTLYSFSLMLAAYILGIALGSLAVSLLRVEKNDPEKIFLFFGFCQIALFAALWTSLPLYPRLPYYFSKAASFLERSDGTFWIYQSGTFIFCFALMFWPTFFAGAALPLASQWTASRCGNPGRGAGETFAVNLGGTLAGTLAAALIFLPWLGIQKTLLTAALLALLSGLAVLWTSASLSPGWKKSLTAVLVFSTLFYDLFKTDWKQALLSTNPFVETAEERLKSFEDYTRELSFSKLLYYKDGSQSTVAVIEAPNRDIILKINGKSDASVYGDLPTELLLGHLPMMLSSVPEGRARRALCVGFGSGITAGAVLSHPAAELDQVEISPEVMQAAPWFSGHNGDVLNHPSFRLFVDDAKSFLTASEKKYSCIVSEPSNPRLPGVANLFTREFFELCRGRLEKGGVMAQWFHLYSMDDETVRMLLRTFRSVFPHVRIWNPHASDIILIGSEEPLAADADALQKKFRVPAVKADLSRIRIGEPSTLLALEVMDTPLADRIAGAGPLHEDFHPKLEFGAARGLYTGNVSRILQAYPAVWVPEAGLLLNGYLGKREMVWRELKDMAAYLETRGPAAPFNTTLSHSIFSRLTPHSDAGAGAAEQDEARVILSRWYFVNGEVARAGEILTPLIRSQSVPADVLAYYMDILMMADGANRPLYKGDTSAALRHLFRQMREDKTRRDAALYYIVNAYALRGEYREAKRRLKDMIRWQRLNGVNNVPPRAMTVLIRKMGALDETAFEEKVRKEEERALRKKRN